MILGCIKRAQCTFFYCVFWYGISCCTVILGVMLGTEEMTATKTDNLISQPSYIEACRRADAIHYEDICRSGYSYEPTRRSNVAFFPVYPLLALATGWLTGLSHIASLILVSNFFFFLSLTMFGYYMRIREPEMSHRNISAIIAIVALCPAGFFFRMAYSESVLFFFIITFLYGVLRGWPTPILAILAGLMTATRPVGVAATAAIAWSILVDEKRGPMMQRIFLSLLYLPIATWGLLAYMGYQYMAFGTPLAFAHTQDHWSYGSAYNFTAWQKAESLLAAEPIWGCYDPGSLRYWARSPASGNIFFNLMFWNPLFFLFSVAMLCLGRVRSWLSGAETVLGIGLLAIPYVTRAYEMSMASHARFSIIVIPSYVIFSRLMRRCPAWGFQTYCVICSCLLMLWSALFTTGYLFF